MNRKLIWWGSVALSAFAIALLGACASAPRQVAELDQARMEVNAVAQDPLAQEVASSKLETARTSLRRAETALEKRRPIAEIQQESYLALRNAQIAREQIAEARLRKEIEQGEAERNRVLLQARSQEAATAQARTAEAQARTADVAAVAASAVNEAERLRAELAELQAKPTDRGMVLTLGDVLFDTGQATLKPGAYATLDRVAEFARKHEAVAVLIEGHTDSQGPDNYNLELSQRRAETVRLALQERGVSPSRIQTRGMGESFPVATNDTAAGRQQNRRVELVFSDDTGVFSPSAERRIGQQ